MTLSQVKSMLTGVPETMLATLYGRAVEAMCEDAIIKDEKAIEIYNSIDYDYEASFGTLWRAMYTGFAIRSIIFDREINKFLSTYPDGTIVNLGEGLETHRFRIAKEQGLWLTVDVPEAINIREQFIKPDQRHLHISMSALDSGWFDYVPLDKPVFITAQGLFMYLPLEEVKLIIQDIANTFNQGYLMFDIVPRWVSRKTMSTQGWKLTKNYTVPQMPWGLNGNEVQSTLNSWLTNIEEIVDIGYDNYPRGVMKWLSLLILSFTPLKNILASSIVKLSFRNQN
ncbi:MAG: class I SAM-dependent methyltransferase [Trichodesmium sp. St2_bin6]|nr:class I SAM-dependent methyltransferase [Trichodesmium sp. St2_bin6]